MESIVAWMGRQNDGEIEGERVKDKDRSNVRRTVSSCVRFIADNWIIHHWVIGACFYSNRNPFRIKVVKSMKHTNRQNEKWHPCVFFMNYLCRSNASWQNRLFVFQYNMDWALLKNEPMPAPHSLQSSLFRNTTPYQSGAFKIIIEFQLKTFHMLSPLI